MVFIQAVYVPIGRVYQDITGKGVQTGIISVNWRSLSEHRPRPQETLAPNPNPNKRDH